MSMTAFFVGMHVLQSVLGSFQMPTFIQTLSQDRPNSQGDRLFTLPPNVLNVDNIKRLTPRKRHLRPKKLLKRLGSDFDSFWMSVDLPDDLLETHVKQKLDTSLEEQLHTLNLTSLEQLLLAKYNSDNGSGDIGSDDVSGGANADLTSGVVDAVKSWLMQKASCPVYYRWEDLGLLYWPRWVRRGMCSLKDTPLFKLASDSASKIPKFSPCSWPPGMHCVPAKATRLKILRWQCRHNKALNNFNRFKLPGVMTPRSLPVISQNQTNSLNNEDLLKHLRQGFNMSLHDIQEVEKILHTRIQHKEGNKQHLQGPSNSRMNHQSESQNVNKKDAQKHINKKSHSFHRKDTSISDGVKHDGNSDQTHQNVGVKKTSHDEDDDDNHTENWNRLHWKERQRTLDLQCKWIKIPYPVTDNCFCSC